MHPTPSMQSCSAWDPSSYSYPFEKCPGYFQEGTACCLPENVHHFQELLKGYTEMPNNPYSGPWWLARQPPAALLKPQLVRMCDCCACPWILLYCMFIRPLPTRRMRIQRQLAWLAISRRLLGSLNRFDIVQISSANSTCSQCLLPESSQH